MCLITYAPNKEILSLDELETPFETNPHGFGVVYAQKDELFYCKKMGNFQHFLKVMERVPEKVPVMIHFRWATHGEKTVDNVHPFPILMKRMGDPFDLCMAHNGTININTKDRNESDTHLYVKWVLQPLLRKHPELVYDPAFKFLIERDIGYGSKLCFLDGTGKHIIYNKERGEEPKDKPGVWYSNEYSFKKNHRRGWTYTQTNTPTHTATTASSYSTNKIPDGWKAEDFETDLPEFIKTMLAANERLLKRTDVRGFGWVHDGKVSVHSSAMANAHQRWYKEREALTATKASDNDKTNTQHSNGRIVITRKSGVVEEYKWEKNAVSGLFERVLLSRTYPNGVNPNAANTTSANTVPSKVVDIVNSSVKAQESKYGLPELASLNSSELLMWVIDYPDEAGQIASRNGFFAGPKTIADFIKNEDMKFIEDLSDFLEKVSAKNNYVMPLDDMSKIVNEARARNVKVVDTRTANNLAAAMKH